MAKKKTVEKGWRERAGLEKRRCKSVHPKEIYIDARQTTIWDFIDPTRQKQQRGGALASITGGAA